MKDPHNLVEKYKHYSTVGQLLEFIEKHNIPMDAKIMIQRVEDVYFEKNGWKTVNKEGYWYHASKSFNDSIDSGELENKDEYPDVTEELLVKYTEEELENAKDKYYTCWCPVKYEDDDNLYLDAHY
jgi:hypothetical protein